MQTERLYYEDAFLKQFTADVLSCEPAGEMYRVVLNRTAFYPEGGGQPADMGVLDIAAVVDVQEENGVIYHICDQPLQTGQTVSGRINWTRRFDLMQQHSGEHILSGILCDTFQCSNVGFHIGSATVTIDYNTSISWKQALAAEKRANEVIWEDRETETVWMSKGELAELHYRKKKELEGSVRIVTFPGADRCACCGTHVRRAGQVGLVKVLSCQKFRHGVRLEIVCGRRAVEYLSAVYEQGRSIGQLLSVKPERTLAAVERLEQELSAGKERLAVLEEAAFAAVAEGQADKGDVLLFEEPLRPDSVRRLADAVAKRCGGLAAVFAGRDGEGYHYALVRSDGGEVPVASLNAALKGRGGGRNGFAQGSVRAVRADIEAFFAG